MIIFIMPHETWPRAELIVLLADQYPYRYLKN